MSHKADIVATYAPFFLRATNSYVVVLLGSPHADLHAINNSTVHTGYSAIGYSVNFMSPFLVPFVNLLVKFIGYTLDIA